MPEAVLVLADHPLVETLPFFGPIFPLVIALLVVMYRDRRRARRERA
jgi:hypothetical protein